MLTPEQSRAARGLLAWTQADLAKASRISSVTIGAFERGSIAISMHNAQTIKKNLIAAGVEFPDDYSVRLKTDKVRILKGENALRDLWDEAYEKMRDTGGEILITHVDEKRTLKKEPDALLAHLERLKKNGITERLLSCEGVDTYLMPKECYRWISKDVFAYSISTYIFQDSVAMQMWNESMIVLIQNKDVADAERKRFEALWDTAKIPS